MSAKGGTRAREAREARSMMSMMSGVGVVIGVGVGVCENVWCDVMNCDCGIFLG
jgi:hypothetical protein